MNVQKIVERLGHVPEHGIAKEGTVAVVAAAGLLAVERFTGYEAAGRAEQLVCLE